MGTISHVTLHRAGCKPMVRRHATPVRRMTRIVCTRPAATFSHTQPIVSWEWHQKFRHQLISVIAAAHECRETGSRTGMHGRAAGLCRPILMDILCAAMDSIAMDPGLKPWRMLAATGPSSRPSRNQIGKNLRKHPRQWVAAIQAAPSLRLA